MHNAAISTRCIKIALKIGRADEINDDVDALTASRFKDLLRPVLGMVVEASCCTEFPRAEVNLLLRPSCDVDSRSSIPFRELNACYGYGRGAGVPEDRFARSEFADQVERLRRRYPCLEMGQYGESEQTSKARKFVRMPTYFWDTRCFFPRQMFGLVKNHVT